MSKKGHCLVSDNYDCVAPAALHKGGYCATCFACGEDVCTGRGCSRIISYYKYGRKRVCVRCIEDHFGYERIKKLFKDDVI